jgi:hypothetical protein
VSDGDYVDSLTARSRSRLGNTRFRPTTEHNRTLNIDAVMYVCA